MLASVLSACASGSGVEVRTGACDVFRPIRPVAGESQHLSESLVEQILTHNETGARLCGWVPPGAD